MATRFIMVQTGLTGYISGNAGSTSGRVPTESFIDPKHWDWLMDELARNRPTYVLDTAPAGIRLWDRYPLKKYPRLSSFVLTNYEWIASVAGVQVYRRKGCWMPEEQL